jgi:putative endonuclease
MNNRAKGNFAENIAADFLQKAGYKIIARNYAINTNFKGGEIDIIAQKNDTIHFVEVKSRDTDLFGLGREAVNFKKQKTIRRLATHYLVTHNLYETARVSLDVIEITNGKPDYFENCF